MKTRLAHPLAAAVLGCFLTPALAQTAGAAPPTAPTMNTASTTAPATATTTSSSSSSITSASAPSGRVPPLARLATDFSAFAGSDDNARALVNGLRSGGAVTLTAPASGGGTGTSSTTFASPTGPMSYGNIRIALSLAREQLAREGVRNPTPEQLQAALVGGSSPSGTTTGILERRADGMGWGRIAHDMGMRLGPVVSGHGSRGTAVASAAAAAGAEQRHEQRIRSEQRLRIEDGAGGEQRIRTEERVRTEQRIRGEQTGRGIVTAAGDDGYGRHSGGTAGGEYRGEHRQGGRIVTAAGDDGGRGAHHASRSAGEVRHTERLTSQHSHGGTSRVVTAAGTTAGAVHHGGSHKGSGVVTASGGDSHGSNKGGGRGKS